MAPKMSTERVKVRVDLGGRKFAVRFAPCRAANKIIEAVPSATYLSRQEFWWVDAAQEAELRAAIPALDAAVAAAEQQREKAAATRAAEKEARASDRRILAPDGARKGDMVRIGDVWMVVTRLEARRFVTDDVASIYAGAERYRGKWVQIALARDATDEEVARHDGARAARSASRAAILDQIRTARHTPAQGIPPRAEAVWRSATVVWWVAGDAVYRREAEYDEMPTVTRVDVPADVVRAAAAAGIEAQ